MQITEIQIPLTIKASVYNGRLNVHSAHVENVDLSVYGRDGYKHTLCQDLQIEIGDLLLSKYAKKVLADEKNNLR